MSECFFCNNTGGEVLYSSDLYRIILIDDKFYPGYLRVVLNRHVKELSDLSDEDNFALYSAVLRCEKIIRKFLNPAKINLASFGNLTPHVHWHIIPRFKDDRHFPNPTWGDITNVNYQPDETIVSKAKMLILQFNELFL